MKNSTTKRKKFDGTFFSEDLLIEILSLLPVVSLIRFKCACKSWYAIFETDNFKTKHLMYSNKIINGDDHHRMIVGRRRYSNNKYCFMSLSNKNIGHVIYEDLGFPYCDLYWHYKSVLGVFNGVVCLFIEKRREIVFWNPATRETKVVAPVLTKGFNYAHGFGYDVKTNDYMLITLGTTTTLSDEAPIEYQVGVYTLRDDSWRKSNAVIPEGFYLSYFCPRMCIKGIYSTAVSRYDKKSKVRDYILLTYDVSNDVFVITLFPEGLDFGEIGRQQMVYFEQLNDSFALIAEKYESVVGARCFEISVLNEYGASGFWTTLYTIELLSFSPFHCPLGFWKNNLLFCQTFGPKLILVDLTTHELKEIQMDGVLLLLMECKESIVSFKKRESGLVEWKVTDLPFQREKRLDFLET